MEIALKKHDENLLRDFRLDYQNQTKELLKLDIKVMTNIPEVNCFFLRFLKCGIIKAFDAFHCNLEKQFSRIKDLKNILCVVRNFAAPNSGNYFLFITD